MNPSALPFIILVLAGFGSFALVLGGVSVWAHAHDRKAQKAKAH